jgi:hypothetical protein
MVALRLMLVLLFQLLELWNSQRESPWPFDETPAMVDAPGSVRNLKHSHSSGVTNKQQRKYQHFSRTILAVTQLRTLHQSMLHFN